MIARELLEGIGGYSGLFFFCVASGIVFPVPEDVALMFAGMRVQDGTWLLGPALGAAALGVLVRDILAWGMGRLLGDWVLEQRFARRMIGGQRIERSQELVERYGARSVLVGRFVVGLRAPIFLVCGAAKMPFWRFCTYDAMGLVVAVPAAMGLGYVFGRPTLDATLEFVSVAGPAFRWAGGAAFAMACLWMVYRRMQDI